MPFVPLGHVSALVRVAMRIEIVENHVNATLPVNRSNPIHERQEVRPLAMGRASTKHFAYQGDR